MQDACWAGAAIRRLPWELAEGGCVEGLAALDQDASKILIARTGAQIAEAGCQNGDGFELATLLGGELQKFLDSEALGALWSDFNGAHGLKFDSVERFVNSGKLAFLVGLIRSVDGCMGVKK